MTVVSKQTLLDYFSSGGRATNPTSTGEWEFEDLIDTLFYYGDKVDGYLGVSGYPNVFVPVARGWDNTGSGYIELTYSAGPRGVVMDDANNIAGYGWCLTPPDWKGTLTATALYRTTVGNGGNAYMRNFVQAIDYFTPGTGTANNTGPTAFKASTAVGAYKVLPVEVTIASQALVRFYCYRFGNDGNDTFNADMFFLGWEIGFS